MKIQILLTGTCAGAPEAKGIQLYREFLELSPVARKALVEAPVADAQYTTVVKQLHSFLKKNAVNSLLVQGKGFRLPLKRAAPSIARRVLEEGEANVRDGLSHVVVQVGDMVFDPCRLRLGASHSSADTYPLETFRSYFRKVSNLTPLLSITPTQIQDRLSLMPVAPKTSSSGNARRILKRNRNYRKPLRLS